jgi:SAM-dependent methyltransferase
MFVRQLLEAGMPNRESILSFADAERFRAYERQRHDELARSYNSFFTPVTALATPHVCDAVHITSGTSVLDVATGPGALAADLCRRGAHVIGVDLSPGMIAMATQQYPGIDFRVADVEHLPFTDGAFHALVCNFAVGHFPYPEAAIAECARVLQRGGRIAVSWWDDPGRQRIQGLFREAIAEVGASPPPDVPKGYSILRFSDSDALAGLLTGAGINQVTVDEYHTTYTVPDIDTLWNGGLGSFAVTASAISHQDQSTQDAIRMALERRAAIYKSPDGYTLPIAFKIGHGRS